MIAFQVNDMSCGHCVSTITKALRAVDKGAQVSIELAQQLVRIEPTEADAKELGEAIVEAGYTPVQVPSGPSGSGG
jgi:copper chaperone